MGVSEKIELLGKGLYEGIPDVLTIKSLPTASELDYVGAEDFEDVMLNKIFPRAIEEHIDFHKLLEIDFQWICRALRILNYGPYYTTNAIFCSDCGEVSRGEYRVDLRTVECKPLPPKFSNSIVIDKSEFIDFDKSITLQLPTILDIMNISKDKLFQDETGRTNRELARMCYMVKAIGSQTGVTPPEAKLIIQNSFTAADYILLKNKVTELTDYGLRAGGKTVCPKCKSREAAYIALVDDKFFRPTVGDIRRWGDDRSAGTDKDVSADKTGSVRKDS